MQGTLELKVPNCLTERFGAEFFRALPRSPGVYLMRDADQRIVYVGKAKDLRARLNSYRHVDAGTSRKTARLVRAVRDITWQVTKSEEEALLCENTLLRELRPRFNRMNTFPQRHAFIALERRSECLRLRLTREPTENCFGAFKGASRAIFAALSRLLWARIFQRSYAELPRSLMLERTVTDMEFPHGNSVEKDVRQFLAGDANVFDTDPPQEECPFFRSFKMADIEMVATFFRAGPARNRMLADVFALPGHLIAPAELDDLIVRARFRKAPVTRKEGHAVNRS